MNNVIKIIIEAVSVFIVCILLTWMFRLSNNATETNSAALNHSDLTQDVITRDNDFIDYLEEVECINEDCTNRTNCTVEAHSKEQVTYYRKEIDGNEVLRLIMKYNEIVDGTVLVRTDKMTRNYNKLYKFVKNMPNNLDYINPTETFIAKIILKDNKPYTMYFTQVGKMFYVKDGEDKESDIEELMFHSKGHNSSNFLMFTESAEYDFPETTDINKIKIYACASGKGTKAGEALAGKTLLASGLGITTFGGCHLSIVINYQGSTEITLKNKEGNQLYSKELEAGGFNSTDSVENEQAKRVFGAFVSGKDGNDGSDGYRYFVSSTGDKTIVNTVEKVYLGGKGGAGGLYGFGGAGGNAGYIVQRDQGVVSFSGTPSLGGSSGILGYSDDSDEPNTKLLTPVIVGYGGKVSEAKCVAISEFNTIEPGVIINSSITIQNRLSGGNGSLYYGGYGGTAAIFMSDDLSGTTFANSEFTGSLVMFNGGGGGAGGYGAGGGEAGSCAYNDERYKEHGKPSGGMVYLQFLREGD